MATVGNRSESRATVARIAGAGVIAGIAGFALVLGSEDLREVETAVALATNAGLGDRVDGLPEYLEEEVATHTTAETGIWVTYRNGVYDITEFVASHPGGADKIMMAAGGSVGPFWAMYAVHKDSTQVRNLLEGLRIGNLAEAAVNTAPADEADPFANDPKRHPALKLNSSKPFNAETPLSLLTDSFLTPNSLFYVRNHLPVPTVTPEKYALEIKIKGRTGKPVRLSLADLRALPQHEVTCTIQCAGNRRADMHNVRPVKGMGWTGGAIGTAAWRGPLLADVLRHVGVEVVSPDGQYAAEHVHFEGMDVDMSGVPYGASVPSAIALDSTRETILALDMNGEPVPADHGFPVRAIIPGVVGARNVKWVGRIELADEEYAGFWQQADYKGFSPDVTQATADYSAAVAIQELPIQSAVTSPARGETVSVDTDGKVTVTGYAWSGGGRGIARVDVSADNGATWTVAELRRPKGQPLYRTWAWTFWEAEVAVPTADPTATIVCKAVDVGYNSQPETFGPIWNIRGGLSHAWHRVGIKVDRDDDSELDTTTEEQE